MQQLVWQSLKHGQLCSGNYLRPRPISWLGRQYLLRKLSKGPEAAGVRRHMLGWMCVVDMCGNSLRLHLISKKPWLPHRLQRLFFVEVQTLSPFQSIFDCHCACQSSDLEGTRRSHVIHPGDSLTWQTRSESLQEQLGSTKQRNHQVMSGKKKKKKKKKRRRVTLPDGSWREFHHMSFMKLTKWFYPLKAAWLWRGWVFTGPWRAESRGGPFSTPV